MPVDLQATADFLTEHRPTATPMELDSVAQRIRLRAARGDRKGPNMKSRLAMMAMLVAGLSLSGTGAGLAVTGLAGSDNAGVAQYGVETPTPTPTPPPVETPTPTPPPSETPPAETPTPVPTPIATPVETPAGETLPATESGGTDECDANGDGVVSPAEAESGNCGEVAGETAEATATPTVEVAGETGAEPAEQVAADEGDTLPFTGFAALPVLFGGIALLAGGLVLRKRSNGVA